MVEFDSRSSYPQLVDPAALEEISGPGVPREEVISANLSPGRKFTHTGTEPQRLPYGGEEQPTVELAIHPGGVTFYPSPSEKVDSPSADPLDTGNARLGAHSDLGDPGPHSVIIVLPGGEINLKVPAEPKLVAA